MTVVSIFASWNDIQYPTEAVDTSYSCLFYANSKTSPFNFILMLINIFSMKMFKK